MNKVLITIMSLGISGLGFTTLAAQTPTPPATTAAVATPADTAWKEIQGLLDQKLDRDASAKMTPQERREWAEKHALAIKEKGLAFYETYPADSRRWTIVNQMITNPPAFITSFGPNFSQRNPRDIVVDKNAAAAWKARLASLGEWMKVAVDLPPDVREAVDMKAMGQMLNTQNGRTIDWPAAHSAMLGLIAKYPNSQALGSVVANSYMYDYEGAHTPAEAAAEWQLFADGPNAAVAKPCKAKAVVYDQYLINHPLDIAFTAADGREVDLTKLHGKVVLVDFWATWCGPCKAEIPNVVAMYKKYHDQGFEIVSISLEQSNVADTDSPEAKTAKLEAAKQKMLTFAKENDMPWVQYYDGKFWKNDLGQKYDVQAIPAMFFLDKNGMVVSTNARGPKLEEVIKKYLSL